VLKFSPRSRYDIIILRFAAGLLVLLLVVTGAYAVAHHGLETLGVISVSCWGIGQLEVNAAIGLVMQKRMRSIIPVVARRCNLDDIPPLWAAIPAMMLQATIRQLWSTCCRCSDFGPRMRSD
jgi:hypothetical protein